MGRATAHLTFYVSAPKDDIWTSTSLRIARRAYDHAGREIRPMDRGSMREHGVRSVTDTMTIRMLAPDC